MRPVPVVIGAVALLAVGFGTGLWLSSAGSTAVATAAPAPAPAGRPAVERVVVHDDDAAALRERVRELEAQLDAEGGAAAEVGGAAEVHTVGVPPGFQPIHLGGDAVFHGGVDGELPPELAARIAAAVESALGGGQLDCDGGDCVMVGPDGEPLQGVQIQTMGDFDPEQMGAILQQALGEGAVIGEPQVGVMILEAEVDAAAVE